MKLDSQRFTSPHVTRAQTPRNDTGEKLQDYLNIRSELRGETVCENFTSMVPPFGQSGLETGDCGQVTGGG